MLRGWLSEEQTSELLAMLEEDDASLHGVITAAGLIATARVMQQEGSEAPSQTINLRASNEANLRFVSNSSTRMRKKLTRAFPQAILSFRPAPRLSDDHVRERPLRAPHHG